MMVMSVQRLGSRSRSLHLESNVWLWFKWKIVLVKIRGRLWLILVKYKLVSLISLLTFSIFNQDHNVSLTCQSALTSLTKRCEWVSTHNNNTKNKVYWCLSCSEQILYWMDGGCRVNTWNPMSVSVLLILLVSTFYNLTNILINNVYVIMLIVNINLAALHFWNIYCCKLRAYFLETGFQGDIWRQIKFIALSSFFCFVFLLWVAVIVSWLPTIHCISFFWTTWTLYSTWTLKEKQISYQSPILL